jgi:hypothetical protein
VPLFKRRAREPEPPEGPRDGDLPLSVDQAALLRRLVREAFAERGIEVTFDGPSLLADDGQRYFLHNIAVAVAELPVTEWPSQAARFAASLLDREDLETLTESALEAATYLRIQPSDVSDLSNQPTAPSIAPGLVTLLAIDLPATVATPGEEYWAARGGADRWRAVGVRNLSALIGSPELAVERLASDDVEFRVLHGESFFTATLALLLPQVLAAYDGDAATEHGVLVAVPHRHQLVWRPLDGPGAVATLNAMVRFAVLGNADGAGPVSPHVFWVRDGRWEQLTRIDDDGSVGIEVSAELQAALESLLD